MKLGDGRKVAMRNPPACAERAELHTQASQLLSEWLALKDEAVMIRSNHRAYAAKLEEVNRAHKGVQGCRSEVRPTHSRPRLLVTGGQSLSNLGEEIPDRSRKTRLSATSILRSLRTCRRARAGSILLVPRMKRKRSMNEVEI